MGKRSHISKLTRLLVWESTDGHCGICRMPVAFDEFEVDHKIPFKKTGYTLLPDLQPAHPNCNRRKGSNIL
jgi:5-methylcytosine-specific restriction endonuclease McrA